MADLPCRTPNLTYCVTPLTAASASIQLWSRLTVYVNDMQGSDSHTPAQIILDRLGT
jgi:hypothetical protein